MSGYFHSGFDLTEEIVYKENGLWENIRKSVPFDILPKLSLNKVKIYYKGYALWTSDC